MTAYLLDENVLKELTPFGNETSALGTRRYRRLTSTSVL